MAIEDSEASWWYGTRRQKRPDNDAMASRRDVVANRPVPTIVHDGLNTRPLLSLQPADVCVRQTK
jgi:hypothetical protein